MIKALMVDVDGVLVCGRPSDGKPWVASIEADLGLSREQLQTEFFKPHWSKIIIGQSSLREHLEPLLEQIAPKVSFDDFITYWFKNDSKLNTALLEELRQQRHLGTKVYLATNQEPLRARHLMEKVGLQSHCDGIIYSAAVGHRKPEGAFFRRAAEISGCSPAQLVLVDDTAENVAGAKREGWNAILWAQGGSLSSALYGLERSNPESP